MAAGMDIGKKMMEKWGWSKGQGLGKFGAGMTTPLQMTKQDGSSTQGRIEQAAPMGMYDRKKSAVKDEATKLLESVGAELGLGMPDEPDAKRQCLALAIPGSMSAAADAANAAYFDIDPREAATPGSRALAIPGDSARTPPQATAVKEEERKPGVAPPRGLNATFNFADYVPPVRKPRVRQWVYDDWRWSKGYEATYSFEEVQLPKQLLDLAKKILGEGSRYPARIRDDTECVVEVTAWGTLLVRPRGTAAKMDLAKRMLYEVLHPHAHELREEALLTPEEMAEAAKLDPTVNLEGDDEVTLRMKDGLARSRHGHLNRVGIGAEDEAIAEVGMEPEEKEVKEMPLATVEDATLVQAHLKDIRIATGATAVLADVTLKLFGKDKQTRKAMQLVQTLLDTGEWVALTEGFVIAGETKEKRRASEGPSEQILLKVPEGPVTQKIEKHLKAMERASAADALKLTSKAVAGSRTLMVEGTRAVHERVKLMVRELSEKGESPMLSKALGATKAAEKHGGAFTGSSAADALIEPPRLASIPTATKASGGSTSVISAPAKLNAVAEEPLAKPSAKKKAVGMRNLPPPRLAQAMAAGEDLFADLPAPSADGEAEGEEEEEVEELGPVGDVEQDEDAPTVEGPPQALEEDNEPIVE